MPTKIAFIDKNVTLDVEEDLEHVRAQFETQLRDGRLIQLRRQAPEGSPVWVNPQAVAYIEGSPSRTPGIRAV